MSVFRVERTQDYTVMSNHHLRNKALSLKAKGLLSLMLSLPEDWDYTLQGLAHISLEKIDAIRKAITELEAEGYITRSRERDSQGKLRGTEYIIREQPVSQKPMLENPTLENPVLEKPTLENPTQLNKEIKRTKEQNTDLKNNPSIYHPDRDIDRETDGPQAIFDRVDWTIFRENIRQMLRQAIERLYYSERFKIGDAVLPQAKLREYLQLLNEDILIAVLEKMKANGERVINPTGYLMSTILNTICEQDSDLLFSLPEEYVKTEDLYDPQEEGG